MERIGDAERQAAADSLAEHLEAGRITVDEHAERVDAVFAARTRRELAVPFHDLPRTGEPPAAATPAVRPSASPDVWQRASAVAGSLALVVFFVCGFALDGWAWAWIVFLLPGALAGMSARRD